MTTLATAIIIAHSHPSQELKPSRADIEITEQLKLAAKLMEISLFDHLIVTKNSYFGFKDEGLMQ
jgi:DNA repair protein RadC